MTNVRRISFEAGPKRANHKTVMFSLVGLLNDPEKGLRRFPDLIDRFYPKICSRRSKICCDLGETNFLVLYGESLDRSHKFLRCSFQMADLEKTCFTVTFDCFSFVLSRVCIRSSYYQSIMR